MFFEGIQWGNAVEKELMAQLQESREPDGNVLMGALKGINTSIVFN